MNDNELIEFLMEDCQFVDIMTYDIIDESFGAASAIGLSLGLSTAMIGAMKYKDKISIKNRKTLPGFVYDVANKIYNHLEKHKIDIVDKWVIDDNVSIMKNKIVTVNDLKERKSYHFTFKCEFKHYDFDSRTDYPYYQSIVKYCKSIGFIITDSQDYYNTILQFAKDRKLQIVVQYDGGLYLEFEYIDK